jgi:hypothetical protein
VAGLPKFSDLGMIAVPGIACFLGQYFDATASQGKSHNKPLSLKRFEKSMPGVFCRCTWRPSAKAANVGKVPVFRENT